MLATIVVIGILAAVYWAFTIGLSIGKTQGWRNGYTDGWNASNQSLWESIKKSYRMGGGL